MDLKRGVLDRYLESLRASATPPTTVRLRRHQLWALKRESGPLETRTSADLAAWLAGHRSWAANTFKSARTTLRSFYRWAYREGLVDVDPAASLPPVRAPQGRPRPAPAEVIDRALHRAKPRERVMILLALLAGLRRSEIAGLHSRDVDLAAEQLIVRGKGSKVRVVPLHPELAAALLPRLAGGPVFPGREDGHLSAQYTGKLLATLLGKGWSGHTLRHAAASRWYAASHDILAVRDLLGHASVATTQVYTATPTDAARSAVLGVPPTSAA